MDKDLPHIQESANDLKRGVLHVEWSAQHVCLNHSRHSGEQELPLEGEAIIKLVLAKC